MSDSAVGAAELASRLLEIGAVVLRPNDPFTWASGMRSPVYCDNRMTLGYPALRAGIAAAFVELSGGYAPDRVAGTATAGIPHAAWLADRLDLPMCYVRSSAKAHGRGNQIEGPLLEGDRVVLVEDLVSTGMSSLAAVRALEEAGATVEAVVAIFSYGIPRATRAFEEAGIRLHTITTFPDLLRAASGAGGLSAADVESLSEWHADPEAWSEARVRGTETA
ncbi:MAG: orotate phosphoribosyltransferase [Rhodothermales bacterium]|jgi:orotate phosphoribosyltransferase